MEHKFYRCCAVPLCVNTSIKTPNKMFITVPKKLDVRKKWFNLARRKTDVISTTSSLYFCEDHFDLPNDMENYMQYHVMGTVSQIRMRPGCIPSKFIGLLGKSIPKRRKRLYIRKKEKKLLIKDTIKDLEEKDKTSNSEIGESSVQRLENTEATLSSEEQLAKIIDTDDQKVSFRPEPVCNKCETVITKFLYKCVECVNFNLCGDCEKSDEHHAHFLLRVPENKDPDDAVLLRIRCELFTAKQINIKPEVQEECYPTYNDDEDIKRKEGLYHSSDLLVEVKIEENIEEENVVDSEVHSTSENWNIEEDYKYIEYLESDVESESMTGDSAPLTASDCSVSAVLEVPIARVVRKRTSIQQFRKTKKRKSSASSAM